jgi:xanthine dehydrogenase accessory factor
MRDVLVDLLAEWEAGRTASLATVVATWNSAPRQPGAAMLVTADGSVVGSVSGGCVESAVYEEATEVRQSGIPTLKRYGVSDENAFAVGLICGGTIDIFVEPVNRIGFAELREVASDIDSGKPVAVATLVVASSDVVGRRMIVRSDSSSGSLGPARLDDAVRDDARGVLDQGQTTVLRYGAHGERRAEEISVFVASYAPKPRMIVFGAIDFAAAVARIGSFLGYRVTVCDARPIFATDKRFPLADEVVVEWPHRYLEHTHVDERTVICVLTHDPKFDVPLLERALRLRVAYVGAMGSRLTNEDRIARLTELGLTSEELTRLHAPIGLDIGARTPEETATSIAAEIIACRWGGSGNSLRQVNGRIHRERS